MIKYEKLDIHDLNKTSKYITEIDNWLHSCFDGNEIRSLQPLLESNLGEIYIFKNDSIDVGFIALIKIKQISHIIYFCVNPEYQNLGYGKEIIKLMYKIQKNNNIVVDLDDPTQNNISEQEKNIRIRRIGFYKKLGFENMFINYEWSNTKYIIYASKPVTEQEFWDFWKNSEGLDKKY